MAILPGSRTQEVTNNLRCFLKAARIVREQVPNARFAVATFKASQAEIARETPVALTCRSKSTSSRTGRAHRGGRLRMAVSGSVSLELLYHTKPTVILYYISRLAMFVQTFFRKVRYITLVNLLVTDDLFPKRVASLRSETIPIDAKVLMPEYLTCEDRSRKSPPM